MIALCAASAVAVTAGDARAQSSRTLNRLFEEGAAAFQARDYATALARFQQAYALSHRPELLMNVGLTYERLDRPDDAAAMYRQYLAAEPTARNRDDVAARIARIDAEREARRAPVVVSTPAPPVVVAPPPVAPTAPPAASRPVWPWITLSAGAALTVTGALLLALPGDPGDDASIATEQEYLRARDDRGTLQTVGAVVGGVGLATIVVGVVGLVASPSRAPAATAWGVRWRPVARGAVVELGHAF